MSLEAPLPVSEEPIDWFTRNLGTINNIVYGYWNTIKEFEERISGRVIDTYNQPSNKAFTEMGLCGSWKAIQDQLGLPPNFEIQQGILADLTTGASTMHTYLAKSTSKGKIILCHTSAQVLQRFNKTLRKGNRSQQLCERSINAGRKDLYRVIGNYGVVYGYKNEIEQYLRLKFS